MLQEECPNLGQVASMLRSFAAFFLVCLEKLIALLGQAGPMWSQPLLCVHFSLDHSPLAAKLQPSNSSSWFLTHLLHHHYHRLSVHLFSSPCTFLQSHSLASASEMPSSILLQRRFCFFCLSMLGEIPQHTVLYYLSLQGLRMPQPQIQKIVCLYLLYSQCPSTKQRLQDIFGSHVWVAQGRR